VTLDDVAQPGFGQDVGVERLDGLAVLVGAGAQPGEVILVELAERGDPQPVRVDIAIAEVMLEGERMGNLRVDVWPLRSSPRAQADRPAGKEPRSGDSTRTHGR
jgi:hypothetical protein